MLLFGRPPIGYAPGIYPYVFAAFAYVVAVVSLDPMRATGYSLWYLLVQGYIVYLLFRTPVR